jgi:H+/Cl- antiporter ClcA
LANKIEEKIKRRNIKRLRKKRRQEKVSSAKRNLERKDTFKYVLLAEGLVVGICTGFLIALFREAIEKSDEIRDRFIEYSSQGGTSMVLFFLSLAFITIILTYIVKKEPFSTGSGIPQVEGELKGQIETKWYKIIIAKFFGGVLSIGGGLALGREGPSIQLGAMVGKGFARTTGKLLTEERMLMSCGAGAGLAAAFGAPLAGVIFSLEELHKNFSTEVLLTTMAATVSSDFIVRNLIGLKPVFDFEIVNFLPLADYWMIIVLGVVLGCFGVLYNNTINYMQNLLEKIPFRWGRIGIAFVCVALLSFTYPIILGGGHGLVGEVAKGEMTIIFLLVLLLGKFLFSTLSFSSGVPGGIFLPLLVLGALTGATFGTIMSEFFDLDSSLIVSFVILGMTGYFAAIVRAPITGVILITEMTGDFRSLLALSTVALVAYTVADLLGGIPIYDQLLHKLLKDSATDEFDNPVKKRKVIFETEIYYGSFMDGEKVQMLNLPKGSLIVSVERDGKELIPYGQTVLYGGDKLSILCNNNDIVDAEDVILETCKTISREE